MTKTRSIISVITVVLACGALFLISKTQNELDYGDGATPTPEVINRSNIIRLEEPKQNDSVSSPLVIRGEAVGYWFFEASFPIKIYDSDGNELGVAIAQAKEDWMTEDFVPFEAVLEFEKPLTQTGKLVLKKDNPSGLPENEDSLEIDVRFELSGWQADSSDKGSTKNCIIAGCSNQLCIEESEENQVTTCEWKEEYACFKTAKCEHQEDGKCGWTPTEDLISCLAEVFQSEPN